MVIACPACRVRYRIDPTASKAAVARVRCPQCQHLFEVSLVDTTGSLGDAKAAKLPVVLVVDDARFFREMIKDILKELPIELVTAADGNEAWQQINALRPQLVLLDLNIPGRSGKEILQKLRQSPGCEQVKVLVMSGVERGEEISAQVRQLGADDFISKSFKPRELQARVEKILGL